MYPKIGGSPLGMNSSAPLKQFLAASRRAAGVFPLLALLVVCLALAPVQQFMGQRTILEAHPGAKVDSTQSLPTAEEFACLCQTNPIHALEMGLLRYEREIKEYTCTMIKKERINKKDHPEEEIFCSFREKPFSVLMEWKKGMGKALGSLYVQGENQNQIKILPAGPLLSRFGPVSVKADDPQVLESSRYTVHEFGLERGMRRTFTAWGEVRDRGQLHFEYLGVRTIKETGDRRCHVIRRTCTPPEEDGMTEITIMLDEQTWLQVGSVLKAGDQLIGYYYFRDINPKPNFPANRFMSEGLKK
jgi:hypothetical protein